MTDIEQFKELLSGKTENIVSNSIEKPKTQNTLERWTGIVVNNEDPLKIGRAQIRAIGFYDNIEDDFLPWAVPDISFIGSTKGNFIIPEIGATVRGYFDKGDVQKPVYDSIAFNKNNAVSDFTERGNDTDYPHSMVLFETDNGDFLTLNRKTGEMVFTHRTGMSVMIDKNGGISINTGINGKSKGNLSINVEGNTSITTKGTTKIKSNGNVKIETARGKIEIGNNPNKQLVNNLPVCPVVGCPMAQGNTQVFV